MKNSHRFEVHIHDHKTRDIKALMFLPDLPYPGLVIMHRTGTWEVKKVQLLARDEESEAEKHNDPHMTLVLAEKLEGSFFEPQKEEQ